MSESPQEITAPSPEYAANRSFTGEGIVPADAAVAKFESLGDYLGALIEGKKITPESGAQFTGELGRLEKRVVGTMKVLRADVGDYLRRVAQAAAERPNQAE